MKQIGAKKILLMICVIILIALVYIVITSFVLSANLGYLVGDVFSAVSVPDDETYIKAFAKAQINWEIAYWSAMISEFTYRKEGYPYNNLALSTLGFTTARFYSFFEFEGGLKDDLMVDAGVKEIFAADGSGYTLVAIAFRGSVPLALNSPTTAENMRRNMDFSSQQWRDSQATVHRGFYAQYTDFKTAILPKINEVFGLNILQNSGQLDKNLKFWITGHSMGGALAQLLTLDLVESGVEAESVLTYGFATPLVGSGRLQEYAQSIGASDRMFNIVHRQDMVGYIGYGLLWGRSIAAEHNIIEFGSRGIFDRSHHSLPRIYLPFIVLQSDYPQRTQFEKSLIVEDM